MHSGDVIPGGEPWEGEGGVNSAGIRVRRASLYLVRQWRMLLLLQRALG